MIGYTQKGRDRGTFTFACSEGIVLVPRQRPGILECTANCSVKCRPPGSACRGCSARQRVAPLQDGCIRVMEMHCWWQPGERSRPHECSLSGHCCGCRGHGPAG